MVIGTRATASPDFLLIDLPGTSGRLDVLLRCVRAALLVSHGLRRDTVVYLVLLGGPAAPRSLRIDGAAVRFLRPDERSLAVLAQKTLAAPCEGVGFVTVKPGVAVAAGGLEAVLDDVGPGASYVLDESGADLRDTPVELADPVFFIGDHIGFGEDNRRRIDARPSVAISVGPMSVHADDVVTLVSNELDRRTLGTTRRSGA